ncbi:MAG: MCE family protein [Actinomycetota bacterium]|nr:MCE family protein [Actinomycetota bacterium]
MVTQAPRRSAVIAAVAFALSCVGLIAFVWTQFGGTVPFAPQGYRVSAVFSESGMLVPGADVRISGVTVGKVTSISNHGVNSVISMDIDPQYVPLAASTRAILREKTLLGEGFVELSAARRGGRGLADGAVIPSSHVQRAQSLDEVLGAFDKPTQQAFESFLTGSATALAGRGQTLSNAIGNLNPTVTELTAMVGVLSQQQPSLKGVIANGATVLGTLSQRSAALRTLITAGNQVFGATAARNRALAAAIDALPPFLGRLRTTLASLGTTLGYARPSLTALAPVAPLLRPALRDLIALSVPAVTVLHAAPGLIADADRALPAVSRFASAFKPAVDALLPAARELAPIISFVAEYRQELVTTMANLAAVLEATSRANTASGRASYIRAISMVGSESPFGQSVREPSSRHNAYFSPGELANVARGGLLSSDCGNAHNASQVPFGQANVPCRVQPAFGWGHGILSGYFPRVRRARLPK